MVFGITGGIGSGKSTVINYINTICDCKLLLTDDIAKELMFPCQKAYLKIVYHFGPVIVDENGYINRQKLSDIVLNDKEQLENYYLQ